MATRLNDPHQQSLSNSITRPIGWVVFLLTIPVLAEQSLVFLVGFFDTWLSGRVSVTATGAIGFAAYVGWLASLLFGTIGIGAHALVANRWGAGQYREGRLIARRAVLWSWLLGLLASLLGYALADTFTWLLGMSGQDAQVTSHYLRLESLCYIFQSVSLTGSAIMRATANMRTPLAIQAAICLLNVPLSILCVHGGWFVPEMGVSGIVVGTIAAQIIGGLATMYCLSRGDLTLFGSNRDPKIIHQHPPIPENLPTQEFTLNETLPQPHISSHLSSRQINSELIRLGLPVLGDGIVTWAGHLLFISMIKSLGTPVFAAHIIGIKIEGISYLLATAWGRSTATLVGQSIGAQQTDQVPKIVWAASIQVFSLAIIAAHLFYFAADPIFRMMHDSPEVQRIGIPAMQLLALYQIPITLLIVLSHAIQGAGQTRIPFINSLIGIYVIRLPLVYLFAIVWNWGLIGAWIGMGIDLTLRCLFMLIYFLRTTRTPHPSSPPTTEKNTH